ncbi:hypothetical protein HWD21_gp011 [Salmonella phage oldekolle]|uniref:Uncharacterized protein n=1 Tax=Salmonella phage oldekolle TaxID=2713308 RepID=A0A6G8RCU8_9CAUD|nr:hypothetical protein HWD21_gp011 [Salmonella phage oldekolle]QIN99253.1 hypothetical protein oldekolle_11 [Salmonella phage oldekolle]
MVSADRQILSSYRSYRTGYILKPIGWRVKLFFAVFYDFLSGQS